MKCFLPHWLKYHAFAAVALLYCAAGSAADTVPTEFQKKLDAELKTLSQRYDDVEKELDEEYVILSQDKHDNSMEIAKRINALRQEHQQENIALGREEGKIRESVSAVDMNPQDPAFQAALTPVLTQQARSDNIYNASLAVLRELYQLNEKRFNQLLSIHEAREQLEENRHREERDLIAERLRNAMRSSSPAMSGFTQHKIETRDQGLKQMEKEAQGRYQDAIAALDEYKVLVNSRLASQRAYLTEQDSIIKEISDIGVSPERRNTFAQRLTDLRNRRMAEERRYQNDVRFIEDKLNFQRLRNRELSRLAAERRTVNQAWAKLQDSYAQDSIGLSGKLGAAEKTSLEEAKKNLAANLENGKKAYEQATKNLDERVKLIEKAMDERLSYLKDRNDIRVRMAESEMNPEKFEEYRSEVGRLEDKRISGEQGIRNQIANLGAAMPAAFRETPWAKGDMATRKIRVAANYEEAIDHLEDVWQTKEDGFQNSLGAFDKELAKTNLAADQRKGVTEERNKTLEDYEAAKKNFADALRQLDQRRAAEEKRLIGRSQYMVKREELQKGATDADSLLRVSAEQLDAQIRSLDGKWADQEREYRRSMENAGGTRLGDALDTASERDAEATDRRNEHGEKSGTGVRNAYDAAKDAIVTTYHDAVYYLTD